MEKKLESIKAELLERILQIHHHDAHFSEEEGYHVHSEGEVYEEEINNAIEEVFQKYDL